MDVLTSREALRRLASAGLPGGPTQPFCAESPDRLLQIVESQRVAVRLDSAVSSGLIVSDDESWIERCRALALAQTEATLGAYAAATDAVRSLHDAGINCVVIKGCSTGPLDYEPAHSRYSSDVDVLVAPSDGDLSVATLGGVTVDVVRSARWHRRFGHARTMQDQHGAEIDLHVRLQHGFVGLALDTEQLMEHTESFLLGGQTIQSLDDPGRLLVAAVHASGVHRSLHATRDVPQLCHLGGVAWQETIDRASGFGIDAFVARGAIDAWSMFDVDPHPFHDWARNHHATGRQRLADRWTGDRAAVLAAPLALPVRSWPAYLYPLAAPSREYTQHSGKGLRQRVRIVGGEFRRARANR